MTEIRTIRQDECEEYLSVLCTAFALDPGRARTAFFGEPYFSLERKWALVFDSRIASILTVVPVEFGDGHGIGIAGVATVEEKRGEGHASSLLQYVCEHYAGLGAGKSLLFARDASLYEGVGFSELDKVYVQPLPAGRASHPQQLEKAEIRRVYQDWATQDVRRLRRDDARWSYWSWTFRTPVKLDGGYFCYENSRVREIVPKYVRLPVAEPMDFYGTGAIAEAIGIELVNPSVDLLLMGRGFDYVPQMFMTDQF
jgi:GNAT superfamily N-acetyltransferase